MRAKEAIEHVGDGDTNCSWCTWNDPKRIGKGTGGLGNQKKSRYHPDNDISKIGQNTNSWKSKETCCHSNPREKSPADVGAKNSQRSNIMITIIIDF